MIKRKAPYSIILSIMLLFTGCGKIPYRPKSIKSITIESDFTGIKNNVILRVKKLTKAEIIHLFGKQGEQFTKRQSPLIPLHISIQNLSNTSLILDPKNISLESLHWRAVSKQLQTNTFGKTMRAIGYGALTATLATGASIAGILYGYVNCQDSHVDNSKLFLNIAAPLILIATPIIAFAKTISSARTNSKIKKDIKEKILHKNVLIRPGQQYDTLLFVRAVDYYPQFLLSLVEGNKNKTDKKITFKIAMGKTSFIHQKEN